MGKALSGLVLLAVAFVGANGVGADEPRKYVPDGKHRAVRIQEIAVEALSQDVNGEVHIEDQNGNYLGLAAFPANPYVSPVINQTLLSAYASNHLIEIVVSGQRVESVRMSRKK